jgi:uncharacterized protein YwqG
MRLLTLILISAGFYVTFKTAKNYTPVGLIFRFSFWIVLLISIFVKFQGETVILIVLLVLYFFAKGFLQKKSNINKSEQIKRTPDLVIEGNGTSFLTRSQEDLLRTIEKPCAFLETSKNAGLSKIGGLPVASNKMVWPQYKGKSLSFLCQIDLTSLPAMFHSSGLPSEGMLYFFYDQEQSAWGHSIDENGSWRIVYESEEKSTLVQIAAPSDLSAENIYTEKTVSIKTVITLPSLGDEKLINVNLNPEQEENYSTLTEAIFGGSPMHHLLGYPQCIQNCDMENDCEAIYQNTNNDKSEISTGGESGCENEEWVLLLQLDSDDDAGMMWGDAGMLYFWIRKCDLLNKKFENTWMILQCC